MGLSHYLVLAAFATATLAYSGEYIPKSFYVIDENGHKSDVVYIRSRRDLEIPLLRVRRGGGQSYASSSAQASANANAGSGFGSGGGGGGAPVNFGDFIPSNINPSDFIPDFSPDLANLAANLPSGSGGGGNAGATSFASASSSSSAGTGNGYGNSGHAGGLGAGNQAGYNGPILFSRFGEDDGTGVHASGAAQGPQGAFSSTSTSSKDGKVKYSVQSGKY